MIANWSSAKDCLSAKMLTHNLRLPERPIADGRWHDCDGGHYLLFPDVLIAIYCGGGDRASPIVWQKDDRLLTHALQQRIADAIARRPVLMQRSSSVLQPRDDHGSNQNAKKPEAASHRHDDGPSAEAIAAKEPGSSDPSSAPPSEVLRMFGVRPGSAVARAMEALAEWLAGGPVCTIVIKERAKQAGFSWATIRRAAEVLPVCIVRDGWGGAGSWWWSRGRWR
jgi:hypothetical protein